MEYIKLAKNSNINAFVVDIKDSINEQKQVSKELRICEKKYAKKMEEAETLLRQSELLMK